MFSTRNTAKPFLYAMNNSIMEFDNTGAGSYGVAYYSPSEENWQYLNWSGFNCMRLPISWKHCQQTLSGALDSTYMGYVDAQVAFAKQYGMKIILDIHDYAQYGPHDNTAYIGGGTVTEADFADLWSRLATRYVNDQDYVILGLMNEPTSAGEGITTATWFSAAQAALTAIRTAGFNGLVTVGIMGYCEISTWDQTTPWYGDPNKNYCILTDPANNYCIEGHMYFDTDRSGTYTPNPTFDDAVVYTTPHTLIEPCVTWCRANNVKLFIGETGCPTGTNSQQAIQDFYNYALDNRDVVIGMALWAIGDWFANDGSEATVAYYSGTSPADFADNTRVSYIKSRLPQKP